MLWDDMTEEQQLACYISYVEEFSYELSGSIYWYI